MRRSVRALTIAAAGLALMPAAARAATATEAGVEATAGWHGRTVRLRKADGVHLATGGARMVARAAASALADLGVL